MDETPQDLNEAMHDLGAALEGQAPKLMRTLRKEYDNQAQAEFDIANEYSPKTLGLMKELMTSDDYDALAAKGRDIASADEKAASQTEADIMDTSGRRMATIGKELQDVVDPEYAAGKKALMEHLQTAFKAVDPNSLTPGESESISRGLGRNAWNVGSPAQTSMDALTFSDGLAKKRAEYNNLIALENSTLPNLKSGLNAVGIATNRSTPTNLGTANFTGIQAPGIQNANAIGTSLIAPATNLQLARMSKQMGLFDQAARAQDTSMKPVTNILGSVGGGSGIASAVGAFCWVAREVYGEHDPRWVKFRYWIMHKAPLWLHNWYRDNGEDFAAWLRDKPRAKAVVRSIMNFILWRAN